MYKKRYELLDTLRGFSLLNMIGYHFIWDLIYIFSVLYLATIYLHFLYFYIRILLATQPQSLKTRRFNLYLRFINQLSYIYLHTKKYNYIWHSDFFRFRYIDDNTTAQNTFSFKTPNRIFIKFIFLHLL